MQRVVMLSIEKGLWSESACQCEMSEGDKEEKKGADYGHWLQSASSDCVA